MNNQPSNKQTIIVAVIAIVLAVAGYLIFKTPPPEDPSALNTFTPDAALPGGQGSELLPLLLELKSLHFDTSIFNDPGYLSLKDFSVELALQPIGRDNPFQAYQYISGPAPKAPAKKK